MIWRLTPLVTAVAVFLAGCASQNPGPPACDGRTRRDANPYGSVLMGASTSPAGTAKPIAAPSSRPPSSQSSARGRETRGPDAAACGRRRP